MYALPVYDGHLLFTSNPDIGEYSHFSPTVLLNPENVGVAFGISLLSCIGLHAEINEMVYALPVYGGHLG